MKDFEKLIASAKKNDEKSFDEIFEMYNPLIKSYSIINGKFDEDLFQNLSITFTNCINKINL